MEINKDHKWLLASHMHKAIRRGLTEEAIWASEHLHNVDRSYLAYRLGVIWAEDVIAGSDNVLSPNGENPWGARHFSVTKNDNELLQWKGLVSDLARSNKDSLPCEHQACVFWLQEFQKTEGPWEEITVEQALAGMDNEKQPWWWRGLMSWRAVGSHKYPNTLLPIIEGEPTTWLEKLNPEDKDFATLIGFKHIEPHIVFLPLVRAYQKQDLLISSDKTKIIHQKLHHSKSDTWMNCALDKHTREGTQAIQLFLKSCDKKDVEELKTKGDPVELLGRLYFWAEGGAHDNFLTYQTAEIIKKDIRKKWLQEKNINGRWFFDTFFDQDKMNNCRKQIVLKKKPNSGLKY